MTHRAKTKKQGCKVKESIEANAADIPSATAETRDSADTVPVQKPNSTESHERAPFIAVESKLVPIGDLVPHPINVEIYGEDLDALFINAVRQYGIYTPLLITSDNRVISGNRRFEAAKQANITEIPVVVFDSEDENDIVEAIVAANCQREKTHEQKGREFKKLLEVETARAKERMQGGVENLPQPKKGKARDIAAVKLGVSGKTAVHAAAVIDKIDELKAGGNTKEAEELKRLLNKSVNKSFNKLTAQQYRQGVVNEAAVQGGQTSDEPANEDEVPNETKTDIITRITEDAIDGVEVWSRQKLLDYEMRLIECRAAFEAEHTDEQEIQ